MSKIKIENWPQDSARWRSLSTMTRAVSVKCVGRRPMREGLSQNEKWGRRDNQDRQPSHGVLLWEMGWLLDIEENYFKMGDVLIAEGYDPRKVAPIGKFRPNTKNVDT